MAPHPPTVGVGVHEPQDHEHAGGDHGDGEDAQEAPAGGAAGGNAGGGTAGSAGGPDRRQATGRLQLVHPDRLGAGGAPQAPGPSGPTD